MYAGRMSEPEEIARRVLGQDLTDSNTLSRAAES
jgi:hypothetical protein